MPRLTIELCTYNRARLLERVLEALFDQTLSDDAYEVVLVNDGSTDDTKTVIERVRPLTRCAFTTIDQANAGLAAGRNAGIARSSGERICFIDDDVLPTPVFAAEHLRSDERRGDVIVRGAVINAEAFDALPAAIWSPRNYSGNYFWTSNVSLRRSRRTWPAGGSTRRSPSTGGRTSNSECGCARSVRARRSTAMRWPFTTSREPREPASTACCGKCVRRPARRWQRRANMRTGASTWRSAPPRRNACSATPSPQRPRARRRAFARSAGGRRLSPAQSARNPTPRHRRLLRRTRKSRTPHRAL